MLLSSTKNFYITWCVFLLMSVLLAFVSYLWFSLNSSSLVVSFSMSDFLTWDFTFSLMIDSYSILFTSCVLLISSVVMTFSIHYMSSSSNNFYFLIITNLFVLSMLLVINMNDLVMIMLGWDGLGVVSFFLIVHYQSPSSIFSGLFTLLMNRLGDALLLVCIMILSWNMLGAFPSSPLDTNSFYFLMILAVAFSTKSAIFPFSPWLPSAMAAPTPISSLVHSSTLVASGLYLMMRFSSYFLTDPFICTMFTTLGVFTSFYAGLNSIVEPDLKKLVALSTLSHLGFITTSLFSGFVTLSFLHLLSHAMFKSLLFMSVGGLMVSMDHFQDSRHLSAGSKKSPFSSFLLVTSSFSLLGMPFFSGFYSKDLILESWGYSSFGTLLVFMIYTNIIFTYIYTMRIFLGVSSYCKTYPYSLVVGYPLIFSLMISLLAIFSIFTSLFFMFSFDHLIPIFTNTPLLKFYPLLTSLLTAFSYFFTNPLPLNMVSPFKTYMFSSMLYLSCILSSLTSSYYYHVSAYMNKSYELGAFSDCLNCSLLNYLSITSKFLLGILNLISLFVLSLLMFFWYAMLF